MRALPVGPASSPTRRSRAPPARRSSPATPCGCCATPRRTTRPGSTPSPRPSGSSTSRSTSSTTTRPAGGSPTRWSRGPQAGVRVRLLYDWLGALERRRRGGSGPAARRRGRRAGVQPAAGRPGRWAGWRATTARSLAVRRPRRLRLRAVRRRGLGRARRERRAVARHRRRDSRARRWPTCTADSPRSGPRSGAPLPPDEMPAREAIGAGRRRRVARRSAPARRPPACCASTRSSPAWRASACGSPTPTSSACPATCRRCAPPRTTASTCGCWCRAAATCRWCGSLSRAGYRALLEGGVRVFEWNGSMVHAKTAVADGLWARVGSTNLNVQSWIGNWELDVAVEDSRLRGRDGADVRGRPANATEVVLTAPVATASRPRDGAPPVRAPSLAGRGAAAAGPAGPPPGPSVRQHGGRRAHRPPPARRGRGIDARRSAALLLVTMGGVAAWWPKVAAYPLAVIAIWLGLSLGARPGGPGGRSRRQRPVRDRAAILKGCITCR